MSALLTFDGLVKRFGDQEVLRGVSLTVPRGSVHFVMGPSGAGKSVLIKHVVGLERADGGSVRFDGLDLSSLDERGFYAIRRRCQLVFQHPTLFDHLSVLENVAMPAHKRFGGSRREAEQRARAALEQVGAVELAHRLPPELGRGVQKRVSIARALALAPEVLLYDEPTTGLDPVSARRIDRLIRRAADELGVTSVVVSHDLASMSVADRVSFLSSGRVYSEGPPTALLSSADPLTRAFFHPRLNLAVPS